MKSREPKIVSAPPSQATGRVQPRICPTRSMAASRASRAQTIRSTWAGPAAWRYVPQVVDTGKSRLVTRNVVIDRTASGTIARRRMNHGSAMSPRNAAGIPGSSRTVKRLW